MARFRFSMESVLNIKKKLEEQAKNEYGQANARLFREQEKLNTFLMRREEAKQKLKLILCETLSMTEIRNMADAVEVICFYVVQQQLEVKRCDKEVEIAREKLTEAMKERKICDKLKEKAYEEFLKEENWKEQKEVDELMSFKHGSKINNA